MDRSPYLFANQLEIVTNFQIGDLRYLTIYRDAYGILSVEVSPRTAALIQAGNMPMFQGFMDRNGISFVRNQAVLSNTPPTLFETRYMTRGYSEAFEDEEFLYWLEFATPANPPVLYLQGTPWVNFPHDQDPDGGANFGFGFFPGNPPNFGFPNNNGRSPFR
jgi:hypothetical protein